VGKPLARKVFAGLTATMTEPPETPTTAPELPLPARTPEQQAKADRAARLAKALRDNLRRRKTPRPPRPGN